MNTTSCPLALRTPGSNPPCSQAARAHLSLLCLAFLQPQVLMLCSLRFCKLPEHTLRLCVGVGQLLLQHLVQCAGSDHCLITHLRPGCIKVPAPQETTPTSMHAAMSQQRKQLGWSRLIRACIGAHVTIIIAHRLPPSEPGGSPSKTSWYAHGQAVSDRLQQQQTAPLRHARTSLTLTSAA